MSPVFGPAVVALYKTANEVYNPASVIKTLEDADNLRKFVALDLKFIIGCDCIWNFNDNDMQEARAAAQPLSRPIHPKIVQMSWRLLQRMTTPPRKCPPQQQRRLHYRQSARMTSYIGMCST